MTWHIQWIKMVAKRPRLSDPKALVTISSEQFQSLLSQAYEKGVKDAKASTAKASNTKASSAKTSRSSDMFGDMFRDMFGGN